MELSKSQIFFRCTSMTSTASPTFYQLGNNHHFMSGSYRVSKSENPSFFRQGRIFLLRFFGQIKKFYMRQSTSAISRQRPVKSSTYLLFAFL